MTERLADGLTTLEETRAVCEEALAEFLGVPVDGVNARICQMFSDSPPLKAFLCAAGLASLAVRDIWNISQNSVVGRLDSIAAAIDWREGSTEAAFTVPDSEHEARAALFREFFFNPFQEPPTVELALLAWSGGIIPALARAAYKYRDPASGALAPARLAVLADALEGAGCGESRILDHFRGPGPHFRGCRCLDMLLSVPQPPRRSVEALQSFVEVWRSSPTDLALPFDQLIQDAEMQEQAEQQRKGTQN
jgi:hypothetical protein